MKRTSRHQDGLSSVERSRGEARLQSAMPGRGGLPISPRPAVFCLGVVCEKALSDSGSADGDDVSLAGLCGDATPIAPTISPAKRDDTEPNQPTDGAADFALGLPTARRHSSRPRNGAKR